MNILEAKLKYYCRYHGLVTRYGMTVSQMTTDVVITTRLFPHSLRDTEFVARATRRVPLVEQEPPSIPKHMNLPSDLIRVCFAQSLVFCVDFCRSLFVLSFFLS
jgi:hypothetical protein